MPENYAALKSLVDEGLSKIEGFLKQAAERKAKPTRFFAKSGRLDNVKDQLNAVVVIQNHTFDNDDSTNYAIKCHLLPNVLTHSFLQCEQRSTKHSTLRDQLKPLIAEVNEVLQGASDYLESIIYGTNGWQKILGSFKQLSEFSQIDPSAAGDAQRKKLWSSEAMESVLNHDKQKYGYNSMLATVEKKENTSIESLAYGYRSDEKGTDSGYRP